MQQTMFRPWRETDQSAPSQLREAFRLSPTAALLAIETTRQIFRRWVDFDIFWHLGNGRLMAADGIFPSPDRFSWSAAGTHVALNSVRFDDLLSGFGCLAASSRSR
jgi:hypothetical protein